MFQHKVTKGGKPSIQSVPEEWISKEFYQEKLEEEDISTTATARTSHQTGSPTLHQEYIRTRTQIIGAKRNFVAHKPSATLRKLISRPKDNRDKTKRNNVIYQIDCNKFYVGQTGRKLCTRIKEHNAAVRRHDPLSLISIHEDQEGHKFNLENAKILAYGDTRHGREFLEAWYSTAGSINRCIELDPIYAPLRARDQHRNRNTQGGPNNGLTNEETRNSSESNQ
ncbi:hypothetical protein T265_05663 [Opisthorchis viverrini]|uniref:GIY-YIG domain-containing protein n=1 Tax=Opisthorchis viverrini TaxID=6198 RepID=A0A074ZV69_OPIVI|nr:hypothetical protein T265_05663 [Opisthorchis viverrini]KER27260.1 hypothetical protein T265_05663 [Opisthorchis viverrini]